MWWASVWAPALMAQSLIPVGKIGLKGRQLPLEERGRILDEMFFEGDRRIPYLWRFYALIVFSSAIAAFGLLNDSAAVVIGAMLIAPLMTPIMAFAAALAQTWMQRQIESLTIVVTGSMLAIGVGWLLAVLIPRLGPDSILPWEVMARTAPNLVDLGIALAAGAAGAYVTVRSEAGSALPGVGIAVALIPPLATVGIALAADRPDLAGGALLLFATNFAAISLAAGITFAAAGFVPPLERLIHGRLAAAVAVGLVLALMVPLALNTIPRWERSVFTVVAAQTVREWNPALEVEEIAVDPTGSRVLFDIVVSGDALEGDPDELAHSIADEINRQTEIEILFLPKTVGLGSP